MLPTPDDGESHDCEAFLEQVGTPRPDLLDTPFSNSDMVLFVDGSALRDPATGTNCVGFAVCSSHDTLLSGSLPKHFSAQTTELIALTEACKLAAGKSFTILLLSLMNFFWSSSSIVRKPLHLVSGCGL